MKAYTSGPWESNGNKIYAAFDKEIIATIEFPYSDAKEYRHGPERESNARLIAAAPEMLEALNTILEFWEEDGRAISPSAMIGSFEDNIGNVVKAAVQKAKARQHVTEGNQESSQSRNRPVSTRS
jgi:hypothetical protein